MADRKSQPRKTATRKSKPRKRDEDEEEPTGWKRITQSPWFLFSIVIVIIVVSITALFLLSQFLAAS
jgi:hypothetical protein